MIPPGPRAKQAGFRRAAIILIAGLAVVALALLTAKVLPVHQPHTPNPVAPLVGAVDKAKATAGAADANARRVQDLINGTGTTGPPSP